MNNDDSINELKRRHLLLERILSAMLIFILAFFAMGNLSLSFMIDRFEQIFAEMLGDAPLPKITQFVINYGRSGLAQAVPIFLPCGAIIFLLLNKDKTLPWILALCVTFFLIIAAIIIPYSLFLPMITIITELNSVN